MPSPDEDRAQLIAQIAGTLVPKASLDPTSPFFDSTDEAANAAFGRLTPGKVEQAGVIYKTKDGKYAYSIPTTQKGHDFALKAINANGQTMAGIFHTHPGDDDLGQVFSQHDIDIAKQLMLPSYVQFQKDGSVRSYTAGKTKTESMTLPASRAWQTVAKGDPLVLPPPKAPGS